MPEKKPEGKKEHKNKPTSKKYSKYKIEGDKITRALKFCPRCGPGVFLSDSNNHLYCGKCHYSEFPGKKAPECPPSAPTKSKVEPAK